MKILATRWTNIDSGFSQLYLNPIRSKLHHIFNPGDTYLHFLCDLVLDNSILEIHSFSIRTFRNWLSFDVLNNNYIFF